MSTHAVKIIEIKEILPHPNADRLVILPIGGWQCVSQKTNNFQVGDKAIYIEPDYVVPTTNPLFSFLAQPGKDVKRMTAIRLRGQLSYGLILPVPEELKHLPVGTNVMEQLGITRYVPPVLEQDDTFALRDEWPQVYQSKFDVESLQNYLDVIPPGEMVTVTEKIDGANTRFVNHNGKFYVGARGFWIDLTKNSPWKRALDIDDRIIEWCANHPEVLVYGEIYGYVQKLKYGVDKGVIKWSVFAANHFGKWLDVEMLYRDPLLNTPPVLYRGPMDLDVILPLAEQDSQVKGAPAGHLMEGLVIVPQFERVDPNLGRVALKHISTRYWEGQ